MAVVSLFGFALLGSACDTTGQQPVPGEATSATATSADMSSNTTPPPAETPSGINLPDALMTEVLTSAGAPTQSAPPAEASEDDRQTLYGLVVLNLVREEQANTVYLSPYLGQGERLDEVDAGKPLSETLGRYMDSVDGERQYFISGFSEAVGPLEEGGKVKDGGVYVTLGEIMSDPAGSDIVAVRGSLYRGLGNAAGHLYRFQRDDSAPDGWKLLDAQQEWSDE